MRQSPLMIPTKRMSVDRNGFCRSFDSKVHTSAGIATPVFSEPVLGKSKVKINRQAAFRSAAVNTAAFAEIDQFIDFFFVPWRQIFSYYGVMRTGVKDVHSTALAYSNVPTQYPSIKNDQIFNHLNQSPDIEDMFGYKHKNGASRLLDLLNLGFVDDEHFRGFNNQAYVPWYLAAYQKIWMDHFRNTSYISNDPGCYNLDKFVNALGVVTAVDDITCEKLTTLRYVPYRKDYFTSIYPSLNYAANMQDDFLVVPSSVVLAVDVESARNGSEMVPAFNGTQYMDPGDIATAENSLAYLSSVDAAQQLSVQSIRAAFALDKLSRLVAYAPKHVADQFEVRFGFRPVAEDINESMRIGSFHGSMSITEVLSTANTDDGDQGSRLGALGGRGLMSSDWQDDIEFEAPEDGCIMGIMYFLPRMTYDAGGLDSFCQILSPVDMPDPVFQNLGLEPVYYKELKAFSLDAPAGYLQEALDDVNNQILGFQERYKRFKCGISRNHGLFTSLCMLSDFSTHTKAEYTTYISNDDLDDHLKYDGVAADFFYCDPADLNAIFESSYGGRIVDDQFFGMLRFKFDVVQNLSVHGQPTI